MDNTVKNLKIFLLFGIIPLIFTIVFTGIQLERCGFKNPLLCNVYLVLIAVLVILSIIIIYLIVIYPSDKVENFVAQPTCG